VSNILWVERTGDHMHDRLAFTAKYWGDGAVVCRAKENCTGPVVDQEFGQFQTWTQANAFASRLNEGLEIDTIEAEQIVAGSTLHTSDVLRAIDSGEGDDRLRRRAGERPLPVQLMLAELDLAVTFCRLIRSKPSEHTRRLLRNARNALFDGMHFVCHSELPVRDLDEITKRLRRLHAALGKLAPQ
jgi:hypothetical protein